MSIEHAPSQHFAMSLESGVSREGWSQQKTQSSKSGEEIALTPTLLQSVAQSAIVILVIRRIDSETRLVRVKLLEI